MITIFSCTNRPNNLTNRVADFYSQRMGLKTNSVQYFDFRNLPSGLTEGNEVFGGENKDLDQIYSKFIVGADKLVFIMPEYNGSFPGILKLFIDVCNPRFFKSKKVSFVGVATGRAGNLRGMDHLTHVMHHLGAIVMPFQLPVSKVQSLMNAQLEISDADTIKAIDKHIDLFLDF